MRILYADWPCFGKEDVIDAFKQLGHEIFCVTITEKSHAKIDWPFVNELEQLIKENCIDAVFTINYFPTISEACLMAKVKYISLIYDSPSIKLYNLNIVNSCNYIFLFDSYTYYDLLRKGVKTVYYAPVAVNTERTSHIPITDEDKKNFSCDVSFVGSLYNEEHNFFDRLKEKADDYLLGYLEGLMNSQMLVYGYNFLEECLSDEIIKQIYKVMPYQLEENSFADLSYVYANYFLCRKITSMERMNLLKAVSGEAKTLLYTREKEACLGTCINKGTIDYYSVMPKVFRLSKINLNITLRSIKSAIPLRAMDIMGAGGFLLTNYQEDFSLHFEPDVDFVYYGSTEELLDKVAFYLRHDKERQAIALNGYKKVSENHTYVRRLQEMLTVAGLAASLNSGIEK